MSKIHVNRDRQNLGQFTPEDVATGLQSGRFLPTDLAWRDGMESWQPLESFTDLPAPEEITPPEDVSPTLAPGSPLADVPPAVPAAIAPTWEHEPPPALFTRIYETVRELLGSPQPTFAALPTTGGLARPLQFLVIVGGLCGIVSVFYQMMFELLVPQELAKQVGPGGLVAIYAGLMIFMPLIIAVGSFISAGIFHVCLLCVGVTPKSFEATYRVICYANGATSVLLLVPLCGGLVQAIWNIYLVIIGFREVHAISTGRAVIAVLLPVVLCCGLIFVLGAAAGLAIPALSQAR